MNSSPGGRFCDPHLTDGEADAPGLRPGRPRGHAQRRQWQCPGKGAGQGRSPQRCLLPLVRMVCSCPPDSKSVSPAPRRDLSSPRLELTEAGLICTQGAGGRGWCSCSNRGLLCREKPKPSRGGHRGCSLPPFHAANTQHSQQPCSVPTCRPFRLRGPRSSPHHLASLCSPAPWQRGCRRPLLMTNGRKEGKEWTCLLLMPRAGEKGDAQHSSPGSWHCGRSVSVGQRPLKPSWMKGEREVPGV